jgi:hypothetical protein
VLTQRARDVGGERRDGLGDSFTLALALVDHDASIAC